MDWTDTTRKDRFTFEMVDPFDLDASRGLLEGVEPASCTITYGYYTDTRIAASFDAVNPNYIENSLIRIHHYVDEWDYHNELGTFFVKACVPKYGNAKIATFELASMLTRISDDFFVWHYAIAAGSATDTVLTDIFGRYNVDHFIAPSCASSKYPAAKVYEYGENVLSTVFEVCDKMQARLDVSGHGIATVAPYVSPSARTPEFVFADDNGTISGDIEQSSNFYDTTNRVGVVAKDSIEKTTTKNGKTTTTSTEVEASGYADLPPDNAMSYSRRGRRKTAIYTEDQLSPFTNTEAARHAQSYLNDDAAETTEYSFNSIYVPMSSGAVAEIVIGDTSRNAMLKSRDLTLSPGMPCSNTFKGV